MPTFFQEPQKIYRIKPTGHSTAFGSTIKALLVSEFNRVLLDGRKVEHRKIETLMAVSGLGRRHTVRYLREIGARRSGRHGSSSWTMLPPK